MRAGVLSLSCALLAASPCGAVFVPDEMRLIDSERHLDSEYFLDLLGFSYPLAWERAWEGQPSGYRINAASLDANDLLIDQSLRLPKRLNDWLSFRYDLVHQGDKDVVELHQWLLLEAGPWGGFSAGVFGEPEFDKENSDIGVLLRWRPSDGAALYASANAVDFPFNQRGNQADRYRTKPRTYELGGHLAAAGQSLRAVLELDMPLIRDVPSIDRAYRYRRTRASLAWRRPTSSAWDLAAGYRYEDKRESDTFFPDPSALSQDFRRQAHWVRAAAERSLEGALRLELGGQAVIRRARMDAAPGATLPSVRYRRWELQPYARLRSRLRTWLEGEVASFLGAGELRRRHPLASAQDDYSRSVEAKLGLGLDFLYGDSGRLGLYGAFDLDDADRHVWDGGNIRAMFLF